MSVGNLLDASESRSSRLCMRRGLRLCLAIGLAWSGLAASAWAQGGFNGQQQLPNPMGMGQANPNGVDLSYMMQAQQGGLNSMPGNQMASPQQMQQMMMLRALQLRGHHHGVQTGMPQIYGAGPQFNPLETFDNGPAQSGSGSGRRSSTDKPPRPAKLVSSKSNWPANGPKPARPSRRASRAARTRTANTAVGRSCRSTPRRGAPQHSFLVGLWRYSTNPAAGRVSSWDGQRSQKYFCSRHRRIYSPRIVDTACHLSTNGGACVAKFAGRVVVATEPRGCVDNHVIERPSHHRLSQLTGLATPVAEIPGYRHNAVAGQIGRR